MCMLSSLVIIWCFRVCNFDFTIVVRATSRGFKKLCLIDVMCFVSGICVCVLLLLYFLMFGGDDCVIVVCVWCVCCIVMCDDDGDV